MCLLSFSGRYPRSGATDLFIMRNITNLLIIDGGSVKTNEEGLVEGLGIVFGSEDEPDQSALRDFFTPDTFVRKKNEFTVPLYYDHGLGPIDIEVGEATLTKTDDGWTAVAKIDTSDDLGKKVYEVVKEKPHGFSTGALQHLVKREARPNNTNFLKQWVVGEISLTERPAERKAVVQAVKSCDGEIITEEAWKPMETVSITLFDSEKNVIWEQGQEVKSFEELNPAEIEIKYTSGSVRYSIVTENDGKGAEITVYEWGGIEDFITHIQNLVNTAAMQIKTEKPNEEVDFDARVNELISKALEEKLQSTKMECEDEMEDDCDEDDEECKKAAAQKSAEQPSDLESIKQELADLRSTLLDREDALTKAKEEIARLEILAGAKETITKNKGK